MNKVMEASNTFEVDFRELTGQHESNLLGCRKEGLVKGKDAKSSLLVAESLCCFDCS